MSTKDKRIPKVYEVPRDSCGYDRDECDFNNILVNTVLDMEDEIKHYILSKVKNVVDVDDIYQDTIFMLSKKDSMVLDNGIPPKKCVYICVGIMLKRYFTKKHMDNKEMYLTCEGDKYIGTDPNLDMEHYREINKGKYTDDEVCYALSMLEGKRYKFNCDIYLLLYLRLKVVLNNEEDFRNYVELVTGVDTKTLCGIYGSLSKDPDVMNLMRVIMTCDNPLEILRNYVYGADNIDSMLG